MMSQQILKSVSFLASVVFLVAALTGCPVLFNAQQAGTVSFSASPDSGPPPLAVHFRGKANLYPPYAAHAWAWDFGDGSAGEGQQVSHTFTLPGVYTVKLQVSVAAPKFRGQQDPPPTVLEFSRTVTVQVVNNPPVANAGPDQNVLRAAAVTLDGSASHDPDGDAITYAWTFVSRPAGSAAVLTGPTTVNPTFTPDRIGNFVIQLIVNDGELDSAPDTVTIAVGNRPPVANAGPDQNLVPGNIVNVTLDGSGSHDPDGDPITYAWSFVTRPAGSAAALTGATTVNPTFVPDRKGAYVIQLVVNDGFVNSAADTVTVTLLNTPPVANAGPDQAVTTGALVTLNGSGSSDADGDPLTYAWAIIAAPAGSAAALTGPTTVGPTFTPDVDGNYAIQLIVNDGTTNSTPDTVTITAGTANTAPSAVAVVQANGQPNANVYANIETPALAPDLDTLYGILEEPEIQEVKQYGQPFYLHEIDTANAGLLDATPLTLIVDAGGYLMPVGISEGRGLAVDPTNGDMWAILGFYRLFVGKQYLEYRALVKINPHTGIAVCVGNPLSSSLSPLFCDLGIDDGGIIYGATDNLIPTKVVDTPHALYTIDRVNTSDTFVIQFPELGEILISPGEVIAFNTDDGLMYHATGGEETQADRMFRSLNLDTLALTSITLQNDHASWMYPTAMAYAPGMNQFYLAEPSEGQALFRISLSGATSTEELVGLMPLSRPVAGLAFGYDVTFPAPLVVLDASDSSDPEGDPLTFEWHFTSVPPGSAIDDGDLAAPTTATPSFTPDVKGTYVIRVRVCDGALYSDWATVTVNYLNTPPIADAGSDQQVPPENYFVQLNGGGSHDPDGGPLTYEWTFLEVPAGSNVDDSYINTASPAPRFWYDTMSNTQPYVLQLTVTDEDGATDTDTVEIIVTEWN